MTTLLASLAVMATLSTPAFHCDPKTGKGCALPNVAPTELHEMGCYPLDPGCDGPLVQTQDQASV